MEIVIGIVIGLAIGFFVGIFSVLSNQTFARFRDFYSI